MSNPFEALDISDDEDEQQFIGTKGEQKPRKTHKERRQFKKTTPEVPVATNEAVNSDIPIRVRENAKQVRHNRAGRPVKGVPQGHPLDRRSGTGRDDRPRKQGGGRGNVGNVHDELNKDKYEKPTQQVTATTPVEQVPQEQIKPEEPQKPTLAEYYQSKGVAISTTVQKKAQVRGEVNAEWLKKEKLTLIQTKEDKKRQEEAVRENVPQQNNTRFDLGFNSEILGFGASKPVQRPRQEEPRVQSTTNGQKGGKRVQTKVNLKEDDFPTL